VDTEGEGEEEAQEEETGEELGSEYACAWNHQYMIPLNAKDSDALYTYENPRSCAGGFL
jgi:hypothetical protein